MQHIFQANVRHSSRQWLLVSPIACDGPDGPLIALMIALRNPKRQMLAEIKLLMPNPQRVGQWATRR